ncbi:MAG: flagellar hook-length control protein FliK [Lachnospiraceae bacterium]|nr:flagellar hook-length control protein FliK [Lachnospiraceae bacterium]
MTSTSVKGVELYTANLARTAGNGTAKKDAFTDCFTEVCSRNQQNKQPSDLNTAVKKGSQSTRTERAVHNSLRDKVSSGTEEVTNEELPEENLEEEVLKAVDEIMAAIAEQLGLTKEQVADTMQQLQMQPEQLLTSEGITDLMIALSGGEGQVNLLTDENLYQSVKEVTQTLEDVMSGLETETGMDAEQLKALLEKMTEQQKHQEVQPAEDEMVMLNVEKPAVETDRSAFMTEFTREKEPTTITGTAADQTQQPEQVTQVNGAEQKEASGKDAGKEQTANQEGSYLQQVNGQTMKADVEQLVQESVWQDTDTEEIMKQIVDYMKVQVKADMTQMEIQLHPASLGTINVHIAAKEGMITAQFTAQNEAVRNALESQVVQLKEALNEQGVKVEAVEVTIASHEFERNLEQNQSGSGHAREEERKTSKRINLNLTGMEEAELEDMGEAEKIAADMMARSGNTVDFSA